MKSTAPRPRAKPKRFLRLVTAPRGPQPGVLRLTVGKKSTDYFLSEIPADFGRGFLLEKILPEKDEPSSYHVLLGGKETSCECRGFLRWTKCKHVEALEALIAKGKLPPMQPAN